MSEAPYGRIRGEPVELEVRPHHRLMCPCGWVSGWHVGEQPTFNSQAEMSNHVINRHLAEPGTTRKKGGE